MPKKIARSAIRQKKLRTEQVRNAQRRRRERLKAENLGFLQLILPETLRLRLVTEAEKSGKSLQEMALNLIAEGMGEKHLIEAIPIRKSSQLKSAEKNDALTGEAPVNGPFPGADTSENVKEIEPSEDVDFVVYPTEIEQESSQVKDEMSHVEENFLSKDDRLVELEEVEAFPPEDESVFSVVPDSEPIANAVVEADDVSVVEQEEADEQSAEVQSSNPSSGEVVEPRPEHPSGRGRGKKKADTNQMDLF